MSESDTPKRVVSSIPRRNILSALTGGDAPKPVSSIAEQKIAQQLAESGKNMAKKLEALTDRRGLLIDKLLRMTEAVKSEEISIHLLRLHLETLRKCSDEFEKLHSEIFAAIPKDHREEHQYLSFVRNISICPSRSYTTNCTSFCRQG